MPVRFGSKKKLYMRKIHNLQLGWAVTSNKNDCAVFGLVDILFTESFFKKDVALSTVLLCSVPTFALCLYSVS